MGLCKQSSAPLEIINLQQDRDLALPVPRESIASKDQPLLTVTKDSTVQEVIRRRPVSQVRNLRQPVQLLSLPVWIVLQVRHVKGLEPNMTMLHVLLGISVTLEPYPPFQERQLKVE